MATRSLTPRLLRRFARDRDGVVAVEFALILPVMIMLMFGMVELTDAVLAKRRVGMAASMLGDLTTNRPDDWIHAREIADVFGVSERVLKPYGIQDVEVTITAIRWDDEAKEARVVWSKKRRTKNGQVQNNQGKDGYPRNSVFDKWTPERFQVGEESLVAPGQHLIVAEMKYDFQSSLSNIAFRDGFDIEVMEVRTPRKEPILRFCNDNSCTDEKGKWALPWVKVACVPADVLLADPTENRC